jgi:hypothetical protein
MTATDENAPGKSPWREMVVAQIRERDGADCVQVAFFESTRFYRLLKTNPSCDHILNLLHDSKTTGHILKVRLTSPQSDIIAEVSR